MIRYTQHGLYGTATDFVSEVKSERSLLQLQDYADEEIDSCDTGLITSDGEEINAGTVGDALCERLFNFKFPDEAERTKWHARDWITGFRSCGPKPPKIQKGSPWANCFKETRELPGWMPPVQIGAYHSYCGTDWQEVATGSGKSRKTLNLKRPICCNKPAGTEKPKYEPCDARIETFNEACEEKK